MTDANRSSVLSEPRWKRSAILVVVAIAVATAPIVFGWKSCPLLPARGDAIYDATVAREILEGHGIRTNLMPIGGLRTLIDRGLQHENPWRSVHKFALSQARIALFSAFSGQVTVNTMRIASAVPYVAGAILFAFLAQAALPFLFALLATATYAAFDPFSFATSGLNITTDTLLFLATVALAAPRRRGMEEPLSSRRAATVGILAGAMVLHRYSMILWLPFFGWAVAARKRRNAIPFAIAAGAAVIPLVLYSKIHFGRMFPSYLGDSLFLHDTQYLSYDPWYVSTWPSLAATLAKDPGFLFMKALRSLDTLGRLASWYGVTTFTAGIPFAVFALLRLGKDKRWYEIALVLQSAAFVVFHLTLTRSPAYFTFLLPVYLLLVYYGLAEVWTTLRRFEPLRKQAWALGALVVLLCLDTVFYLDDVYRDRFNTGLRAQLQNCNGSDEYRVREEVNAYLSKEVKDPGAILMGGNKPWEFALENRFRILPLVESREELETLRKAGVDPDYIYVPASLNFAGDGLAIPGWRLWRKIYNEKRSTLERYRVEKIFSDGSLILRKNAVALSAN